jgi:hypothetical protein
MGGPGGMGLQRTVTGAPYSAQEVTIEQQVLPGGNVIQNQRTANIARDSQGRVRRETIPQARTGNAQARVAGTAGQQPSPHITIHDPVAGVTREVDTQNKVVHEMAVRQMGPRNGNAPAPRTRTQNPQTRPADPNVVTEDLGTQTMNGVAATGTRVTRTIPAGEIGNSSPIQIVHETWISADLKVPVMTKFSDPRFGTTVTQLNNIARTEPDAALFQVPTGFTVTSGGPGGPGRGRGR